MKEILNYIIENALALIAILISLFALYQTHRNNKSSIKREIKKKQAQLDALNNYNGFMDHTTMCSNFSKASMLSSEIEELKKMV